MVKKITELLPELITVSLLTFCVETVNLVNQSRLVISSQEKEILRKLDLVC